MPDQAETRNRLLALMRPEDFALLAPRFEPIPLPKGHLLIGADAPIDHVVFPERGISSVMAATPEGHEVEAGLYGREGVGPLAALMGIDRSPYRTVFQVGGEGWRLPREALAEAMEASATLRALLLRFVQVMSVQTSFTALSNAVHPVDERLARWLLMCHDRHDSDDMPLTHEFLSLMLAVRRPSVTTSLHVLEGNRFIRAERGYITIRDRKAMEEFAGDSYGRPEAEYRSLIGPMS